MAQMQQNQYGLIILGNSGVGKSFIANLFLQTEQFVHKNTTSSVTKTTEFSSTEVRGNRFLIFNIPGLIEADQKQIDINKEEIYKAFTTCPNSVVLFVFGVGNGGRINNDDIIAFQALHKAYPFESKSLAFVINQIPLARSPDYEGDAITRLEELLEMEVPNNVCFLDKFEKLDNEIKQNMREKLLAVVQTMMPKVHTKQQDIRLQKDELFQLRNDLAVKTALLEKTIVQLEGTIKKNEKKYRKQMKKRDQEYDELKKECKTLRQWKADEARDLQNKAQNKQQHEDKSSESQKTGATSSVKKHPLVEFVEDVIVKVAEKVLK